MEIIKNDLSKTEKKEIRKLKNHRITKSQKKISSIFCAKREYS
tara:strand:+ start:5487 stop:5615 length:129 start_codon:yes stop_codon:yes gene_type:complete